MHKNGSISEQRAGRLSDGSPGSSCSWDLSLRARSPEGAGVRASPRQAFSGALPTQLQYVTFSRHGSRQGHRGDVLLQFCRTGPAAAAMQKQSPASLALSATGVARAMALRPLSWEPF